MTNEYSFEELNDTNIDIVESIYLKTYHKKSNVNWRKKYDHSYLGYPLLGNFIKVGGEYIGFIGICLYEVEYGEIKEIGCHFTDSMLINQYQGKGYYGKLLTYMQEYAEKNNITFFLGFGNKKSFPIVRHKQWDICVQIMGFSIPIKTYSLYTFCSKLGLKNWYHNFCKKRLTNYITPYNSSGLSETSANANIQHSINYFNQKNTDEHYLIKIHNTYVWLKIKANMEIGFLYQKDEKELYSVFETLIKLAKKLHVKNIIYQCYENAPMNMILQKKYESFKSWEVLYTSYHSQIPKEKLSLQLCDTDGF